MNNIERLEEGWFFHDHAWQLLHQILKEIKEIKDKDEVKTILDFGAGSGIAAAVIKAVFPDIKLLLLDNDPYSKDFWKKRNLEGALIDRLDYLDSFEKQDIIICSHVIEHIDNSEFLLRMLKDIAKYLILVVPDNASMDIDRDHKWNFNRLDFKELIDENIDYKSIKYYPLYHPHINNLIAVITL